MLSLRMLKDITNNNFGETLHSSLDENAEDSSSFAQHGGRLLSFTASPFREF